ncbi:MAG: ribosomal-processing cysteine protease Prp [Acidaminococcaceae bacterium]|nr:ribosomal-processing cysteine protease Prp [Acidaminococcaceae bacterium]
MKGHAGLAEAGKDVLCAAVSSITQTPILGMEEHLQRHLKVIVGEGVLQVQLDRADEKTQLLLMTMVSAIRQLAGEYPQNVRFEEQR